MSGAEWCGSTGTDTSPLDFDFDAARWWDLRWRRVPDTGIGTPGGRNLDLRRCRFTAGHRFRSDEPCGGSSDLAAAFGLVGGPGAVGLPSPVDDLRTETRAVGW